MKNVLIFKFPYSSLYGGGEQHTIMLVNGLLKKGFNFYLSSSCRVLLKEFKKRHWPAKKSWGGIEPVSKVNIIIWPLIAPFAFINLFFKLIYYKFSKKIDILYCLSLGEKLLATFPARLLGIKVIWVEHLTLERWLSLNPLKILYRLFSNFVTIVAVSEIVKEQLIKMIKVKRENIVVIYNGVNLNLFKMRNISWEQSARYNIGCIARLEKEKGIEFLIQAIKIIREFIPFVRLIIVGEGKEKKKLQWLSERLNLQEHIQWVGHQGEIERWYHYFDAFVLPSVTRESFGITLIEAMASGVPVIASKIGGTPEIIKDKVTGLLTKPGSSQDLADKLMFLYNNRSATRNFINQARALVEEKFSLERMSRDYYLLFRK